MPYMCDSVDKSERLTNSLCDELWSFEDMFHVSSLISSQNTVINDSVIQSSLIKQRKHYELYILV